MNTQSFYADLPALSNFYDLANPDRYVDAPDDWYVLITDVVDSTDAISNGGYKEVNLLGASSIIAVLNALQPLEIPFVFGGDGASLLVPPGGLSAAQTALLGVKAIARQSFDIDLRVGTVPIADIRPHHGLKVAKLSITPLYSQASFMGGGLTFATELVKREMGYQLHGLGHGHQADLSGLECRWQEVPNPRGHTLSLIVTPLASSPQADQDTLQGVLTEIHSLFGRPEDYHPITPDALNLSFNPQTLSAEVRARSTPGRSRWLYWCRILAENVLGWLFMTANWTVGGVNWGRYQREVRLAADYQKIDDALRMVLAGTSAQIQQLIHYLEAQSQLGHLVYGVHVSDRALLTCLILDRQHHHFHLVDGADGGYALAATDLKGQLHQKAQNWKTYAKLARRRRSPKSQPSP